MQYRNGLLGRFAIRWCGLSIFEPGEWRFEIDKRALTIGIGLVAGIVVGAVVGAITGNVGLWIGIGVSLGLVFGAGLASQTAEDSSERQSDSPPGETSEE